MKNEKLFEIATKKIPSGYKLLYLTEYGSSLYGTNSASSDIDLKGVFLPSLEDMLLGKDLEDLSFSTGNNNSKNTSDDIDVTLYSFNKFMNLLVKGETGALDILFSMFREDTIWFQDHMFSGMKLYYRKFISKNANAFMGYVLNQTRIYGLKGKRYNILQNFYEKVQKLIEVEKETLKGTTQELCKYVEDNNLINEYIFFTEKDDKRYLSVLGKEYEDKAPLFKFKEGVEKQLSQYGHRAKSASQGTDWKALSHAVRVISELEEMIAINFITFPIPNAEYVKFVKYNATEDDMESIMEYMEAKISNVEKMVLESTLPDKVDQEYVNTLKLKYYKLYFNLTSTSTEC